MRLIVNSCGVLFFFLFLIRIHSLVSILQSYICYTRCLCLQHHIFFPFNQCSATLLSYLACFRSIFSFFFFLSFFEFLFVFFLFALGLFKCLFYTIVKKMKNNRKAKLSVFEFRCWLIMFSFSLFCQIRIKTTNVYFDAQ